MNKVPLELAKKLYIFDFPLFHGYINMTKESQMNKAHIDLHKKFVPDFSFIFVSWLHKYNIRKINE